MAIPAAWVDELFTRLTVRYGQSFMRQYTSATVSPDDVRSDWANVLHGCTGDQIAYGLEHLSPDHAPNAMQFRALCRSKPDTSMPALPAPNPAGLKRLAAPLAPLRDIGRSSVDDLLAFHRGRRDRGEPMSVAQRAWLKAAEDKAAGGGSGPSDPMGEFCPPPEHTLPPGMRKQASS
jgi:hypothetical protein